MRYRRISNPTAITGGTPVVRRGAVLVEVVVAMSIFFAAAAVIVGGLGSSITASRRVSVATQAEDLGISLMSELQMGVVPLSSDGPTPYDEPLADWTWQVVISTSTQTGTEDSSVRTVMAEVVIVNVRDRFTHRIYQLLPADME